MRVAGAAARAGALGLTLACAAIAAAGALANLDAAPGWAAGAQPAPGPAFRLIQLPSGRAIVESRPDLLATPVAPGSLAKLAALVALYEQGFGDVRIACTRRTVVDGKVLTCVHPDLHRPLTPAEAVGHSCNTYFGVLAQRLSRQSLDAVLVRLGLGPIAPGAPVASAAVGLGGVRATPAQLLEAFLRVVDASRVRVAMPEGARRAIRAGTDVAARTGTAAALAEAGFSGLAKTGTAPMPGGGVLGLVTAVVNTELPTHAIVVVAPGAAGADAAAIAADLLSRHGAPRGRAAVRVGVARTDGVYDIRTMAIEDYVSRVVAGEMGADARPAALEAMAITARTFVRGQRGRHEREGFDVCDLSHCQTLGTPAASTDAAARATEGLVLRDHGMVAEVYYSASCGGHTERPSSVWPGARDAPHLPARPDPWCGGGPSWRSEIVEPDLRRVLQAAGLRGGEVSRFLVAARSGSGRAARLAVGGMTPDEVGAGRFRTAAGRLLGWRTVKSTLFDVTRTATGYALTGRGSGHGVGLCVLGAMNRARGGGTCEEILAAYFPGLQVAPGESAGQPRPDGGTSAGAGRVRITLPESERQHLGELRRLASAVLRELSTWLGRPPPPVLDVVFHPTAEAYARATGQPWWTAGASRGTRIDLLPRGVLASRSILIPTLRHEIAHVLADPELAGRPLWVREGLAAHLAREGPASADGLGGTRAPAGAPCPSDQTLRSRDSAEAWRRAYDAAGACVARALAAGSTWRDLR